MDYNNINIRDFRLMLADKFVENSRNGQSISDSIEFKSIKAFDNIMYELYGLEFKTIDNIGYIKSENISSDKVINYFKIELNEEQIKTIVDALINKSCANDEEIISIAWLIKYLKDNIK